MAERLGDVIILSRTAWQDVASENEPPLPTHHHLEDEDMGTEDWFTVIWKLGDSRKNSFTPPWVLSGSLQHKHVAVQ